MRLVGSFEWLVRPGSLSTKFVLKKDKIFSTAIGINIIIIPCNNYLDYWVCMCVCYVCSRSTITSWPHTHAYHLSIDCSWTTVIFHCVVALVRVVITKIRYFREKFWLKDKGLCDLVMDSEVQYMRKTSFQQQYISIMVHILPQKIVIATNMFRVSTWRTI